MTRRGATTAPGEGSRARSGAALRRATGALSTAATNRMDARLAWFRELSAEERSWVGLIVQAGIKAFVEWYDSGQTSLGVGASELAASVFGAAPRALTGAITLQQTVDLVRLSIEVVEENLDDLVDPADAAEVHGAISHYAREVAFATAEVYARAAESRGAWDARLEALVVDSVLRAEVDEAVLSRASALGWAAQRDVVVLLGRAPVRTRVTDPFTDVRRIARNHDVDALCAVQGDRLVVLLGGVCDVRRVAAALAGQFGPGPVVAGPTAADLAGAHVSARHAVAAYDAAPGWPEAPRPVLSSELLPERALAGDPEARRELVRSAYLPVAERPALAETLAAWFASGGSIEGTARALIVHANTVRYRLRQVADLTGLSPMDPREALTLQIAQVLGRQDAARL